MAGDYAQSFLGTQPTQHRACRSVSSLGYCPKGPFTPHALSAQVPVQPILKFMSPDLPAWTLGTSPHPSHQ